ncbi:NADH-cytochrome b5 reductase [Mortierella alpina]|nr:NADH-cytochrome b5 reductase [Mortierella alpina]
MPSSNTPSTLTSSVFLMGTYLRDTSAIPLVVAGVGAILACLFLKRDKVRTPPLDAKEYRKFTLVEKIVLSPNTAMYKFALPNNDDVLNLPMGQHVTVMANINGKDISRSYTPTSGSNDLGHFVLCIKSYPQGNISGMFSRLAIGDQVNVRGPKGHFSYTPNMCRAIGMIAGGTGITPMLQLIRTITKNPEDKTLVNLLFANVSEQDILLRAELDLLSKEHPQFKVYYVLSRPSDSWTGARGYINADMIKEHMPAPSSDIKILLCGPQPMVSSMVKITQELGYEKVNAISKPHDQVFKF